MNNLTNTFMDFHSIGKFEHIFTNMSLVTKVSSYRATVKPVCNDHFSNKIYYPWFIQWCVLMKTEGTNLTNLLTISALGHLDELQKAQKYPISGRYRQVSLYYEQWIRIIWPKWLCVN